MNFLSLFKRKFLYKISKKTNIDLEQLDKLRDLDELLHYYGSDKANVFKISNNLGHGFSKFYSHHLNHLKNKKINILEVGSFAGSSASAFAKYFPNSKIYCFDINISKFKYTSKNIKVFGLDIKNEILLNKAIDKITVNKKENFFDIIIDDGSHYLSDILISIKNLFKYLKKNGIYIIEDFKHPNYYNYNKDIDDILIDQMLESLKEKKLFKSNILQKENQIYLHDSIKKINIYKGNLKTSDICFIERN